MLINRLQDRRAEGPVPDPTALQRGCHLGHYGVRHRVAPCRIRQQRPDRLVRLASVAGGAVDGSLLICAERRDHGWRA